MSTTTFNDRELTRLGFSPASIRMLREVYRRSSGETAGGVTLDQVNTLLEDIRRVVYSLPSPSPKLDALRHATDGLAQMLGALPDYGARLAHAEARISDLEQIVGAL